MINVLFWKTLYNDQCSFWKTFYNDQCTFFLTLYNDHCTVLKNALQWSLYCCKRRSTIDQCSVFEKPSIMINILFWKTLYNDQCSVFEKPSTMINIMFWKTLYNDQCSVFEKPSTINVLFLKNALQWSMFWVFLIAL